MIIYIYIKSLVIEINFEFVSVAAVWNFIFVNLRLCYVKYWIMVYMFAFFDDFVQSIYILEHRLEEGLIL